MANYIAQEIKRAGSWSGAFEVCIMTYEDRMIRRKVVKTEHDTDVLVDLKHATSLNHGDAFVLTDGRLIEVFAADEDLYKVEGDLTRLAWHIGNRHTPCQIERDHLLIQRDLVIRDMLLQLGAKLEEVQSTFTPEGGAYGHGRTHSHAH